ncbi:DB domain-containing protein [Meloidogyne graminicola]|uniref:DB domain-containing protein n=1 Tax=Meloidogyne graminicola TaxID=189291 RepID=A0A8T0A4D8_9BILA|nr:DB domain-containing protein [Meloidogyne graminicola]
MFNYYLFYFFIILIFPLFYSDSNLKLKKCCQKLINDDKECVRRFCDFEAISQANVLNYLSTCTDRGETVGHMWDCASSRIDHTECCKKKGVSGKCLEYCAAHDGVPTNYLDYLFCVESFNEIRDCFKEYLEIH